ncbi:MAG: peptide chain release factor N(5)-glutamine methyltransferase, partial [Nitrospinaceae bacterium]|nr:peptide chain release factor N(5)-glutamine methyltransferase [Nitrospinaceae bacterium]
MRNVLPTLSRWPEGSLGGEFERFKSRFSKAGIENAATDAAALLCWVAGCDRSRLAAYPEELLSQEALDKLSGAAQRREAREPLAYIVGEREFWSLTFEVGPTVLIPRPETELLVERALSFLSEEVAPRILDLCAGSGAVGVALAKEIPGAHIVATDLSEPALALVARNAWRNGMGDRVETIHSDLFEKISRDGTFDV